MTEPTAITKGTEQIKAAANDRRVQLIAGAALVAFGLGVYLGLKLKGPQDWVPPVDRAPVPCADCAEKAVGPVVHNGGTVMVTEDELRTLVEKLESREVASGD